MNKNGNKAAGGIASSFATKTLLFSNRSASQAMFTVQSQQTCTVNTHRATSTARTFATAIKSRQLFKA